MRFSSSLERDARTSELFFDGLVLEKNSLFASSQITKIQKKKKKKNI